MNNTRNYDHASLTTAPLAALRYELGDDHEFDFIEAANLCDPAPGRQPPGTPGRRLSPFPFLIRTHRRPLVYLNRPCAALMTLTAEIAALSAPNDHFFAWINAQSSSACQQGLELRADLDAYIASEGPFEGVMAFSEGAAVAATYILYKTLQNPAQQIIAPVFKCAIFFCGALPADPAAMECGRLEIIEPDGAVMPVRKIWIPTASIWGARDFSHPGYGSLLHLLCDDTLSEVVVHFGGHEIPGAKDMGDLKAAVGAVRRTIERALSRQ